MQIIKTIFDNKINTYTCALNFNNIYQKNLNSNKDEKYEIEGFITTFGNVDNHFHVIMQECADEMLKNIDYNDIKILSNHDEKYGPIGKLTKAEVRTIKIKDKEITGIYAYIELYKDIKNSNDVINLLKKGLLNKFSIGFGLLESKVVNFDSKKHRISNSINLKNIKQITEIYKIELLEISIVLFPANTEARIMQTNNEAKIIPITQKEKSANTEIIQKLDAKNNFKIEDNSKKTNNKNISLENKKNKQNNLLNNKEKNNLQTNNNHSIELDKKIMFSKLDKIKTNIKKLLESKLKINKI